MKHVRASLIKTALLGWSLMLAGCVGYMGYGPPPHAPAHGYRYDYHGHELLYDRALGAYIVTGRPGVYFYGGTYYRYERNHWYYSRSLDKGWQMRRGERGLPPGLAKKYRREDRDRRR
ncbi:MAG: hypothetical protein P8126_00955 [Gammaproteobacteria bacterium]